MKRLVKLLPLLALLLAVAAAQKPATDPFDPLFWSGADLAAVKTAIPADIVNKTDRFGRTPLHYAAALNPKPKVIEFLVKEGAEIDKKDLLGYTPLMYAAAFNENPEVVKVLVKLGASLKAKDLEGRSALHLAALNSKSPKVILALLELGADPTPKDIYGKTALDYALENPDLKSSEAIRALQKAPKGQ